jgi:hypothetical protein
MRHGLSAWGNLALLKGVLLTKLDQNGQFFAYGWNISETHMVTELFRKVLVLYASITAP